MVVFNTRSKTFNVLCVLPGLLPPWEGPLIHVVDTYLKGQMAYMEYRKRSDLVNRFNDLVE